MAGFTSFPLGGGGIAVRVSDYKGTQMILEMTRDQGIALAQDVVTSLHRSGEERLTIDELNATLAQPLVRRRIV